MTKPKYRHIPSEYWNARRPRNLGDFEKYCLIFSAVIIGTCVLIALVVNGR